MYIGNNKVLKVYAGVNAVSQIVKNGQKLYEPKPNVITGKFMGNDAEPVSVTGESWLRKWSSAKIYIDNKYVSNDKFTVGGSENLKYVTNDKLEHTIKIDFSSTNNISNIVDSALSYLFKWCDLTEIDFSQCDFTKFGETEANETFGDCKKLKKINFAGFKVKLKGSMNRFIRNTRVLTEVDLSPLDVSNVTDFYNLITQNDKIAKVNVTGWNTSNATSMSEMFYNNSYLTEIIGLDSFNTSNVTNMSGMFGWLQKITSIDISTFDLSNVTNMNEMFNTCEWLTSLKTNGNIGAVGATATDMFRNVNTTGVYEHTGDTRNAILDNNVLPAKWTHVDPSKPVYLSEASGTFTGNNDTGVKVFGNNAFTTEDVDIYVDDVKIEFSESKNYITNDAAEHNVKYKFKKQLTTGEKLFGNIDCKSFDVSSLDISQITNMQGMFTRCPNLTSLDLSAWDMTKVTNLSYFADYCTSLTSLKTNGNIGNNMTNTHAMFDGVTTTGVYEHTNDNNYNVILNDNALPSTWTHVDPSKPVEETNVIMAKAKDTDEEGALAVFNSEGGLTDNDVDIYVDGTKLTVAEAAYYNVGDFNEHVVKYKFKHPMTKLDSTMGYMLTEIDISKLDRSQLTDMSYMFAGNYYLTNIIGLDKLDTSKVTNMEGVFNGCVSLTSLDVSNFNTSQVTNMSSMFNGCEGLTEIIGLNMFNTSQVTNMSNMFGYCTLTSLDVSSFSTSQVTNMSNMFDTCTNLTSLDVSNFITSQVTNMSSMFYGCEGLAEIIGLNMFNTSQVTDMTNMFFICRKLTSLDVSNFDTSKVTNMRGMFEYCTTLTNLNVSNFNTSQVTDMSEMFNSMTNLTEIIGLNAFDTSKVTNMYNMFGNYDGFGGNKITSLDLTNWDMSKVTSMEEMFDGMTNLISLTTKGDVGAWKTDATRMFNNVKTNGTYYHDGSSMNAILDNNVLPSTWKTVNSNDSWGGDEWL